MNAQSQTLPVQAIPDSSTSVARIAGLPWHYVFAAFGAACIPLGTLWDISWHETIGRDTFWTPAHMMIYLGGTLPGCICGWMVLKYTFWPKPETTDATVPVWGFRGPIGGWVIILGSFIMLLSGPFDDWWHNAYGLDVKIVSPPHALLALGTTNVAIGALILTISWQNRATPEQRPMASGMLLFCCGVLVIQLAIFITEFAFPNQQHAAFFYQVVCLQFPFFLVVAARATPFRWAATGAAAVYTGAVLAMVWILPLFAAHPMLAPIYIPVDHMVPPPFPLLIIVPAFGLDLVMQFFGRRPGFWRDTGVALLIAVVFFLLLLAVQWPISKFLLSPAADNRFFAGGRIWPYFVNPGPGLHEFWDAKSNPLTVGAAVIAILLAVVPARIGLGFANWLRTVKR